MTWKRKGTSACIDVDLYEFSVAQLLQGLINTGSITEDEAEAIQNRPSSEEKTRVLAAAPVDEELQIAKDCLRRGTRSEALVHLERFLGRDFVGVLQ